jgi:hypothetical protein
MPDRYLPLIKFTICTFKGIIADQVPGIMNECNQDMVGSNDNLDVAIHSEVPNISFLWFISLEIFFISINHTCKSTMSNENEETKSA